MIKKEEKKKEIFFEKRNLRLILSIFSFLLFLFFGLSLFHNWANLILIKLHFCDHFFCMIYSLIWFFSGIWNLFHYYKKDNLENNKKNLIEKEKKRLKKEIFIFILVLILGIILMNIIPCDNSGKFYLNSKGFLEDEINESEEEKKNKNLTLPNEKPGIIASILETDENFDPDTKGKIIVSFSNGSSLLWGEDYCVSYSDLREYFLLREGGGLYNTSLVDCREYFDDISACCENGICRKGCLSYDCEEFANENGFDNSLSEIFSLGECEGISQESCGGNKPDSLIYDEETYCCVWNCNEPIQECGDSEYPSCDGVCPPDNICTSYDNNCVCVPDDFQFCEDSYPDCDGYCESGICISDFIGGCYCENNPSCENSFELGCTGYCEEGICKKNNTICNCVIEKLCQDSDGDFEMSEQITIPGNCSDGNSYTDYCIDNSKLMEFKCSEDICVGVEWQCKQKCIESESGAYCNETTTA